MSLNDLDKILSELKNLDKIKENEIKNICLKSKEILKDEPNIISLESPITICGDIHGQFDDLLELFQIGGKPPETNFLFLGDYVDRGYNSIETILTFLILKIKYSDRITLIRGNHESKFISQTYGLYEECNRPWARDLDLVIPHTRDKAYYDHVFDFILKHTSGLHPMVYSQGIEDWKENFEWFQSMMEKADVPWEFLYLLEVRNEEWTPEQLEGLAQFIRYLWEYSYNKCDRDQKKLSHFINKYTGFNLLVEPVARIGRGMPCTVQSDLMIRLGDMKTFPCHRTSYPAFCTGQFVDDPTEELKFVCENAELFCAIYGLHHRTFPYCITCPINHLCTGQCLGACYESTRNLFTPIPSVCAVKYTQIKTHIEMLIKYGLYQEAWENASAAQRVQMENLRKYLAL